MSQERPGLGATVIIVVVALILLAIVWNVTLTAIRLVVQGFLLAIIVAFGYILYRLISRTK